MRLVLVLIAAGLAACAPAASPPPDDAVLVRARLVEPGGARVFALYCASCHGETGNAPGTPAVMGPRALDDFDSEPGLRGFVSRRMPPRGTLEPDEVSAVSRYLWRVARLR